jgi:hypothetical protein
MVKLLDAGFHRTICEIPIFPLGQNKRPLEEGGFHNATDELGKLARMFANPLAALIGMPTGAASGFDVIDLDPRNGSEEWMRANEHRLPRTRAVRTRSGGVHLFFKSTPGLRISAGKIAPGVDIRAEGGYVVDWESMGNEVLHDVPPAEMPDWLVVKLKQAGSILHDNAKPMDAVELAPPSFGAVMDLLGEMPNPAEATRDDYTAVMMAVQGCIRSGTLTDIEADAVKDQAAGWAAKWEHPHASDYETERNKWDTDWSKRTNDIAGWRQLLGVARKLGVDTTEYDLAAAAAEFDRVKPNPSLARLLSAASWSEMPIPEPRRLLGDVLTTTARMFLVGRTGLGKTLMGLGIGGAIASGVSFLGWPASAPAKVLYIDGEMPAELIKPRTQDVLRRLGNEAKPENLMIFGRDIEKTAKESCPDLPPFMPLNTEEGHRFIMALIAAVGGVELIVFDNVMSLITGDQKDEIPWSDTNPLVQGLSNRRIGQLWLDHTGHNTDRQYGSSTKAWRFDAVGVMQPIKDEDNRTSFTLSFDFPGKARRRIPGVNGEQFATRTIRLVDDIWTWEMVSADAPKPVEVKISPNAEARYKALLNVLKAKNESGCVKDEWYAECVRLGYDTAIPADASGTLRDQLTKTFRARMSDLAIAKWIQVNGEAVFDLKTVCAI